MQGENVEIGLVGFALCIAGVPGALCVGPLMDRTHKYK